VVIIWSYSRGSGLSKEGETAIEVTAYAAHLAAQLGAHIIKVKLPSAHMEQDAARKVYEAHKVPVSTLTDRVRHVSPDHADSNYRMAREAILSKVGIPPTNVHRIAAEKGAQQAADEYEAMLRTFFDLAPGAFPCFDLILLGMGPDGHTASLFPTTAAVHEHTRLVVAPWVEKFKTFRITMTPPVLCNAAHVVFAAGGADKAETLCQVLHGDYQPDLYPSQVVKPTHGTLLWLVDEAAARHLS
jgi:6-phosphogluconolactonase